MAKKKSYSELLKDPRWQKKRLKVLERDNFLCSSCGDGTTQLHVHHKKYINGKKPWEYKLDMLTTLCCDCHSNIHKKESIISLFSEYADSRLMMAKNMCEAIGENINNSDLAPILNIISRIKLNGLSVTDFEYDFNQIVNSKINEDKNKNITSDTCMNGLDDILAMFDED